MRDKTVLEEYNIIITAAYKTHPYTETVCLRGINNIVDDKWPRVSASTLCISGGG